MNVPYRWLREYTDINVEPKKFAHEMNMTGTETTGFSCAADTIKNVVAGLIEKIESHPNADKLVICSVNVGKKDNIQIVTAAKNMKVGDIVPVALDGSVLASGKEIHAGELRGVMSYGMFCSVEELGLTVNDFPGSVADGLLILNNGACELNVASGDDICRVLSLDDTVFVVDIVTNRPDCLSIIGVAREAACTFRKPFEVKKPVYTTGGGNISDYLSVSVKDVELCKRYMARVVKDIKIAPSPLWLVEKLRDCGVRAINNIVDITNYVMLEYGQPMHAFDYECVGGGKITVRRAENGEKMNTLDGQERELDAETLVIADAEKPIAVAGVMGGENSEIKPETKTVVFESANFFAPSVRKTSKKLGLRTESSARFEKGLDPLLAEEALDRACELICMLGAGTVVDGTIDINNAKPEIRTVPFEYDWINSYININASKEEMTDILERLGMKVENGTITVPSFRSDIENKYDIAEEIAKFYGYDRIEPLFFKADVKSGGYTKEQKFEIRLGEALRAAGLDEILTYSFVSPKCFDKIRLPSDAPERNAMKIKNPLGEDTSIMRTSALPSMLEVLARNYNFRNPEAYLYEIATVYIKNADETKLPDEKKIVCAGFYGNKGDFYTMKGIVESILAAMNTKTCEFVPCKNNPSYHPGRAAEIIADGKKIGIFGQIHPLVAKNYGVNDELYAAEIPFDALYEATAPEKTFTPLPKFPAVTRDLALICKDETSSGEIEKKIRALAGPCLEKIEIFDVYKGAQVAFGHKSIAYALVLRSEEKTLGENDIDQIMTNIINGLEKDGISLRR
ncbi:MAG: phenylalanine--tRNA ligase subunit beta [Clostridia bacterium]|nr:phenylalanine--tRNA ligase subunit beta [Clostridia bacterium]